MPSSPTMPVWVGVSLSHAALQGACEQVGARALHIKGPALVDALGGSVGGVPSRQSMDADLWVSPSDMDVLRAALREQGWRQYSDFSQGSSFEHAATWVHGWMAAADLHRTYPGVGVDPQVAFDALWEGRQSTVIAGRLCWVPAEAAQRLILLVNAARDGLRDEPDIVAAWDEADEEQRLEVRRWAARLGAEVPLAAAVGELEAFSGRREYRLWRALSSGGAPRLELWWGRVLAEPTLARSVALAVKLALPNPGRERVVRGRRATAVELAGQLVRRVAVGVREFARLAEGLPSDAEGPGFVSPAPVVRNAASHAVDGWVVMEDAPASRHASAEPGAQTRRFRTPAPRRALKRAGSGRLRRARTNAHLDATREDSRHGCNRRK